MPKRTDIKSVMVIGSGPIVIGQAAEFDYSGTQACRVLREEGIRVILVNSNPATIMTDPEMADATYIEPIATPILEQIIAKERPDALLPTLGGQTALNAAMALGEAGVLKKYNVELIGASLDAIDRGEDRELFKKVVDEAGAESARSEVAHSMKEVDAVAAELGYPLVVRPSFTMGGLGSGIAHDEEELHRIAGAGLHYSPTDEVLLEEGIEGWKEFELELMRDRNDNVVVVCPIENGYTLDEIRNDITQSTPASFEPTIDYVVTKVPRFAFEKFPGADPRLTTSMKSVGEAMALGGNFQESLGKAMRSIDKRHMGFSWDGDKPDEAEVAELLKAITVPTEHRYLQIQRALWGGATERQIFDATKIDPWFVKQLALINQTAMEVRDAEKLTAKLLKKAKLAGLSDLQIAHLRNLGDEGENTIRELRWTYGLRPVYKTVDTPYYYSCYADETELRPREREAVIILGSGPNRIGQGIEFDYTCVHAVQELGKDYDTIMVNCNPETVSTDYDMSNRLYFEPLTFEDVLEIYEAEKKMGPVKGVIVQLGGQTPLSLAARLKAAGVPILGTTPESIDLAENRELFGEVLRREHMNAPRYGTALSLEEACEAAHNIGYPVLVRPSYVLGGRGMEIVYDDAQLTKYVNRALDEAKADTVVSGRLPSPLLIDKFLQDAIEIMGFDRDFPHAFAKSQLAAYDGGLPTSGNVFISVNDTDKRQLPLMAVRLVELGFSIWATEGTASVLRRYGIDSKIVDKISTRVDSDPDAAVKVEHAVGGIGKNVVDLIEEGKIDMILNTPNSRGSRSDGYSIRAAAIAADLPQFTTMTEFSAVLMAIEAVKHNDYQIMSIQEHAKQLFELESQE